MEYLLILLIWPISWVVIFLSLVAHRWYSGMPTFRYIAHELNVDRNSEPARLGFMATIFFLVSPILAIFALVWPTLYFIGVAAKRVMICLLRED